jgi:hypothetical protein
MIQAVHPGYLFFTNPGSGSATLFYFTWFLGSNPYLDPDPERFARLDPDPK